MADYTDGYWQTRDGLRLHYRDYAGREDRPPMVCLPGLTRNARDFAELAAHLCGEWRVICIENRGRGMSDYAKDSATYNPLQYNEDLALLLSEIGAERFVAIGTSLGGLMTMLFANSHPGRLAGAVINDIGPVIDPEGLARIASYVGQGRSYPTWMHAARALEESTGATYPDFTVTDWLALAKRLMVVSASNRIVFDYDMKIAEPFADAAAEAAKPADPWAVLGGLVDVPALVVRGALSDILSDATYRAMLARLPKAKGVVIDNVGHAPLLTEPEALAAIDALLGQIG